MKNKVFVGNLAWDLTEAELADAFEEMCGPVIDAKIITDRETRRSRGFGFITFESDEGAKIAHEKMAGVEIKGRPVNVNNAHDRKPRNDSQSRSPRRPRREHEEQY